MVIVVGDHGEAFGTHGQSTHASFIYEENVHIPCIIYSPLLCKGDTSNKICELIDIVPTILEATGVKAPETVNGIKQSPIEGVSMMYTFDKANAAAPTRHKTQYFELISNRGIYNDGWYANTTPPVGPWVLNSPMPDVNNYKWELYNLKEDYSQANDLAAKMPDKLKQMQALFVQEAAKYNVLPLDNSSFARAIAPRPSATAGQTVFTYAGEMAGIPTGNAPNILNRSFKITADVDVPESGDGMIATLGGRWGGFGLYMLKGVPVFNYNMLALLQARWAGDNPIPAGKHTIVFDFKYDGPGIAKGGTGLLMVDGKQVATLQVPKTVPFLLPGDESFDIGIDTRTGVNDLDYQVPFRFNGKIANVTFNLGLTQLTAAEEMRVREAAARARD